MEKINEWLNNPDADYFEGISLLQPHCRNRNLLNFLQRKENENNREKLRYELSKLDFTTIHLEIGLLEKELTGIEIAKILDEKAKLKSTILNYHSLSSEDQLKYEELEAAIKVVYETKARLSNELVEMDSEDFSDEQRAALYAQIEAEANKYNEMAQDLENLKNGIVKSASALPEDYKLPETLEGLKVARQPLMEKRSKLTAKLKKMPNDAKAIEWQTELVKANLEIDAINVKLDLLK